MHLDVLDLRNFYYRTQLGRVAQRAIRDQVVKLWPPMPGQTVAGFGFAVPLLRPYLAEARRVIGLMPGPQGVMPWPAGKENVSVLCEETRWPLPTGHCGPVGRDARAGDIGKSHRGAGGGDRVLGPGGRALFIVPNRAGLWARRDVTPFGFGRPYSAAQLEAQLKQHGFTPERSMTVAVRAALGKPVLAADVEFLGRLRSPAALAGRRRVDGRGPSRSMPRREAVWGRWCAQDGCGRGGGGAKPKAGG